MEASWPVIDGAYVVGDADAPVAVCTLTSETLVEPLARVAGVAIAGKVHTANLGIERIVVNVSSNPAIRFLLMCGKESKLFQPGQSLSALVDNGVDAGGRILGAPGYDPVLPDLSPARVDAFRRQIELLDWTGEEDVDALQTQIAELAGRNPGRFTEEMEAFDMQAAEQREQDRFVSIRPGGRREPLQYDPKGYFVITLDRDEEQIVLRHYLPDHIPAHEMRGRVGASMFLGLIREGLVSQLSHAGYLGEELAKAQAALTLNLRYDQDRPLRRQLPTVDAADPAEPAAEAPAPPTPRVQPPVTLAQLQAASEGDVVNVTMEVTEQRSASEFGGKFLEPTERDPFSAFTRTDHPVTFIIAGEMKTIMGSPSDVVPGAIVRVKGPYHPQGRVDTEAVVILTNVASVE